MVTATVLLTIAGLWLVFRLRGLLVLLLVALFLSFMLEPAVRFLVSKGWSRGLATVVVGLGLFLALVGFLALTLTPLVSQANVLISNLPQYVDQLNDQTEQWFGVRPIGDTLQEILTDLPGRFGQGDVVGRLFGFGSTIVGVVFAVLTVTLFAFYLVADGPRFRHTVLSAFPPDRQREILQIWETAIDKTGGYIYSRLLLAGLATAFTWVALLIIGVPYPLPLAVWVGVISQLIPAVGTYLAALLPILVALFNDPIDALWVTVVLVGYQQLENYLFAPHITGRTMALHPAVAFGAVIAGAAILGLVGALIALPTAATIQAFVGAYLRRHDVVGEAGPET